ncbi:mitochondrial import inner membrane translocase subunit Tim10 B [Astyanax mexicanus]|uniref:Mitochondrial import inner membrane translocase subunit Tim10 B n=2 Tax=Astyanax mexicanus TaxID=7994 RepID=A0A8T2L3S2_ASTMX|nr:mitochondrial import inner membrane translocase subunit Tim10 B [Astyanax mexicanus]
MDADSQLRNLRDFLLVYNRMTEICFQRCTANFNYRNLTMDEERCVDNCASKLIRSNHRLMGTYVKLMPAMVQRRMEEMESKAAEAAKMEEAARTPAEPLAGGLATTGPASAALSAEHVMTAETPAASVSFPPLAAEPMLSDLSSVPAPATGGTATTIPSLGLQTENVSLVPSLVTEPTTLGSSEGTSSSINSNIAPGIQIDKLALKQITLDSSSTSTGTGSSRL